ncbi:MAG TPA: iron chelate uptake ABC transporter family permease subunit [Saprospiraceae bacterium]|nr:iron chelate uptake ABC transporter family permease subunit [Saprospiraceae bacterium]
MDSFLQTISSEWALRALFTSVMVGVTCGMLGSFIVLRNMSLIGDALSHSILPGIYVAFILVGYSTLGFFAGSVAAGIITAIAITWIQRNVKTKNDAAIGIVFTSMFSLGVMGISNLNNSQGNHLDLKDFLFGNVLGISNEDIVLSGIIMVYTVASILVFYRYLLITTFQEVYAETMGISTRAVHYFLMLMLSFAVVAALRSVGVILVVAMLITPASTALLLSYKLKKILWLSAFFGALSSVCGLWLAIVFDTTPGPAMVVCATLFFLVFSLLAPEKGLVSRWWVAYKEKLRIAGEDIIKLSSRNNHHCPGFNQLNEQTGVSVFMLKKAMKKLINEGYFLANGDLTPKGKEKSLELIRAHRLWEMYQVQGMGLNSHQIHDDAERIEHHLTAADMDELDAQLGFPQTDPHGSPIPPRSGTDPMSIFNLKPRSRAKISLHQTDPLIESELWEMGILPNEEFVVGRMDKDFIYIRLGKKEVRLPLELSKKIRYQKT